MTELLQQLDWQRLMTTFVEFLPNLVAAAAIMILFWLLYRATRHPVETGLTKAGMHPTLVKMMVRSIYRFSLLLFALVMAADQVGINVAAALAGIGVAGLAVGFAAQESLANIIAGVLIFIDKPFEVGDWVSVESHYGEISEVTLRSTRIRTNRNTWVVLPNNLIINSVLDNHSKRGVTRIDVPMGIAYKENILDARRVILDSVATIEGVIAKPGPDVVVTGLGDSSVNLSVRVWIEDASREQPIFFKVMENSKLALDAAGIEIPYHHLQLFVENIEERVWKSAAKHLPMLGGSYDGTNTPGPAS